MRSLALVSFLTFLFLSTAPPPVADAQVDRTRGQRCQWCEGELDPEDYHTPPGLPYTMFCTDECITEWRKSRSKERTSYLTPVCLGSGLVVFAIIGFFLYRAKTLSPHIAPSASEIMRERAATGRAPGAHTMGTAHYRCQACGRNLPNATACTYCGGKVEPI